MIKKILLQRKMNGFENLFALGLVFFVIIYIFTNSFLAAITVGVFFWVLSIVAFICYYFELADSYYKEVKTVRYKKGNFITNFFIFLSIFLVGIVGALLMGFIVNFLLSFMPITNSWMYGLVIGISAAFGIGAALKIYYIFILKKGLGSNLDF
ncbi:MAG: hypothetical protein COX19_13300 [Desulfobacterales bacterium CG23_combo_of_CG06-09_8_20_14_all_51_8]|nr:MAG: hypothetical protein COX19_13300 [Desulfobacterales bacterium CG23_combo_of_CG06-09_8_20_14_all_51_8]